MVFTSVVSLCAGDAHCSSPRDHWPIASGFEVIICEML
jgi:hypothetical protein